MAWHIDEQVVRGEIDNRVRGRVTGRIWFSGRELPTEIDLAGNAWHDLAGRRLAFVNPAPKPGLSENFSPRQAGVVGDCTASRKVRVPDIPLEQIGEYYAAKKPFPWHWRNSLYLEWFSATNGRVVIESANFVLTIADETAWEMSAEAEEEQRRANAEALREFMQRLADAAQPELAEFEATDPEKPQTEAEAEKQQVESDRLADRITARIEREGVEHATRILEEELERWRAERGEAPLTPEQEAERAEWFAEMNQATEETAGTPDLAPMPDLTRKHPLTAHAYAFSLRLIRETEERAWIPGNASAEHPVVDLVSSVMSAGAKLAGALDGRDWPPGIHRCAGSIVRLKRARNYFDHAHLAAESCREEKLVDAVWLADVACELQSLISACDNLITELRAKLGRGSD